MPLATAVEVYDVPPPPEHRTLQLQGPSLAPGTLVWIDDASGGRLGRGDVVDNSVEPPSITVYVPESEADGILEASGLRVVAQ